MIKFLVLLSVILFTGCPSGTHTIRNQNSKPNRYISSIAQCEEGEYKFLARGELNSNSINLFSFSTNEQKLEKIVSFELNNSDDVVFSNVFCQNQNIYALTQKPNSKIKIDTLSKKVTINSEPNRGFMISPSEILVCDTTKKSECFYENSMDNLKISYSSLPSIETMLKELNSTLFYYDQEVDIYPYINDEKWDKKSILVSFRPKITNPEGYLLLLEYQNNQWDIKDNTKEFYLSSTTSGYPHYLSKVQHPNFTKDYVGIFESLPLLNKSKKISISNHQFKFAFHKIVSKKLDYSSIIEDIYKRSQGKNNHNENITPTFTADGSLFFVFIKDNGLEIEFYNAQSDTPNIAIKFGSEEKMY